MSGYRSVTLRNLPKGADLFTGTIQFINPGCGSFIDRYWWRCQAGGLYGTTPATDVCALGNVGRLEHGRKVLHQGNQHALDPRCGTQRRVHSEPVSTRNPARNARGYHRLCGRNVHVGELRIPALHQHHAVARVYRSCSVCGPLPGRWRRVVHDRYRHRIVAIQSRAIHGAATSRRTTTT